MTNTSVSLASSLGPAVMEAVSGNNWTMGLVWVFWVASIHGTALAGVACKFVGGTDNPAPVEARGDS